VINVKSNRVIFLISIFLVVYAGVYSAAQLKTEETDKSSSKNETYIKPRRSMDIPDSLGIMNYTKDIWVGLGEIVKNEGTSEDVLELTESIETELNQTVANQTLDESQEEMVRRVLAFIDSVETLVEDDVPPEEILEPLSARKSSK
jgi:hypothetical protein